MEFSGMPWTVGREKGVWLIVAAPEASGVKRRDEIVSINGKIVRDFSLAEIQQALLGTPGDKKEVVLQRGGQPIKLKAVVAGVL
jgi:C-terminal processing protease CtpA/Prc